MGEYTYSYERAAMRGEEMPDGLNIVDQLTFLCLRNLYAQNKTGIIDRETGSKEKGKLRYQHDIWARRLMFEEKLTQHYVKLFKRVELASSDYAKNRTLENADKLHMALYGMEVPKHDSEP